MSEEHEDDYEAGGEDEDGESEDFDARFEAIQARVIEAIEEAGDEHHGLIYSAYEMDGDDLPVDNLDHVAIDGECRIVQKHDLLKGAWGEGGSDFESETLNSPTWLELCVVANRMLDTLQDFHHCYLEDVAQADEQEGAVLIWELVMGS